MFSWIPQSDFPKPFFQYILSSVKIKCHLFKKTIHYMVEMTFQSKIKVTWPWHSPCVTLTLMSPWVTASESQTHKMSWQPAGWGMAGSSHMCSCTGHWLPGATWWPRGQTVHGLDPWCRNSHCSSVNVTHLANTWQCEIETKIANWLPSLRLSKCHKYFTR